MSAIRNVGIVGLGRMGLPMAKHLAARGFNVVGCDPAVRDAAIAMLPSPREVAKVSDLVIVVVGFDREVEEVMTGILEGSRKGLVVALASTVAPRYAKKLALRLAGSGVILLDIPLARGEAAAIAGKLLVYGAGDAKAFESCLPAFRAFASDVFHLGDAGAGQVGKMVNTLILWACISANDESLRLGEALGVDPAKLREALRHGSAQNWAMDNRAEDSGMPWAEKDMSIVLEEADLARISLPLSGTVKEVIKGLKIRMGLGLPRGSE